MTNSNFLSPNQKNLIGIFGGVGPLAHIEFEKLLLSENYKRGARKDQDHPSWIVVSGSGTPDRTTSLLNKTHEALAPMISVAKTIEASGASCMFVICNTAHGYYEEVQKELSIPWIHLMDITAHAIQKNYPEIKKIGILGTDATVNLKLYHNALEEKNLHPIAPEVGSVEQKQVMDAIYDSEFGIKSTGSHVSEKAKNNLIASAEWCEAQGAQAIIPACTEVSVALSPENYTKLPLIDPLIIAANCALDIAYGIHQPEDFMIQ
jgi:aspartate racemase